MRGPCAGDGCTERKAPLFVPARNVIPHEDIHFFCGGVDEGRVKIPVVELMASRLLVTTVPPLVVTEWSSPPVDAPEALPTKIRPEVPPSNVGPLRAFPLLTIVCHVSLGTVELFGPYQEWNTFENLCRMPLSSPT